MQRPSQNIGSSSALCVDDNVLVLDLYSQVLQLSAIIFFIAFIQMMYYVSAVQNTKDIVLITI